MNQIENEKNIKDKKLKDKKLKDKKLIKQKKPIMEAKLNNTDKITLQLMTNPHYNNLIDINKNNTNKVIFDEKREDIIYFKKNILNLNKKILNSIESNEQINLPDNILSSCDNYLVNIVNYIHHRKIENVVQKELDIFNNKIDNDINNNINNDIDSNKLIDDSNTILYKKENKTITMDKFIKTLNKNKKQEIIPNKKNIYK